MIFGRMHTRKWDPRTLFPNGMGWRALLIVRVQYKKLDPEIVFSPIDFKIFGKQAVWEMDYPINKVMLIIVVQQKAWWFLMAKEERGHMAKHEQPHQLELAWVYR